jgi:general secretion pathway protein D
MKITLMPAIPAALLIRVSVRVMALVLLCAPVVVPVMAAQDDVVSAANTADAANISGGSLVNLNNADIGEFIQLISEQTGRNFIVDPRVKGKVTVVSNTNLTTHEVYELFLSVLNVHGYVALPVGASIKIVPNINGRFAGADGNTDASTLESLVTQVLTLQQVAAVELVPILRPMLPSEAHLTAVAGSNKLLVSSSAFHTQRITRMVRLLDQPIVVDNEVIYLNHAKAADVANILTKLQQTEAGAMLRLATIVADERTNSLVVVQTRAIAPMLREIIDDLDLPTAKANSVQTIKVVYLQYADAEKLAPIIERVASGNIIPASAPSTDAQSTAQPTTKVNVSVQAEPSLNALIISAAPQTLELLEALIADLDVRRAQVLVEAVIAEISSTKAAELGMQWALKGKGGLGVSQFSGNNLVNLFTSPLAIGSGFTLGVGSLSNGNGIAGIIRALSSDASTNIVATPSLVTLDNMEAEIVIGKNVPFVTGQYASATTGGSTTASPFQTIKRENVGVKLKILPKINQGDAITLTINQEVSSVALQSTGASDLITNTRTISTTVIANDKDLIILGGLIDDQAVDNQEKVPILGDLPVIGGAFRYKKSSLVKRNLMVFIRPTIIRDAAMLESLSHKKYQFLRAQQLMLNQTRTSALEGQEWPLMPLLNAAGEVVDVPRQPIYPVVSPVAAPEVESNTDKVNW